MKRLVISTCLVIAGGVAGWWLRDLAYDGGVLPANNSRASSAIPIAANAPPEPSASTGSAIIDPQVVFEPQALPDAASFGKLLEQREYERSIVYYETALQTDESYQALLKPRLEDYLKVRVQECADGVFVDLVDLWLAAYYADIEVLLLLADNQRFCSSSEEAARTLQIASTYAIQPGQQESVAAAVDRLITATDERLFQQQDWVELLGFYEFLEAIDLATDASQLRRALLYARVGELRHSREILMELRDNDDRLDTEWTAALNLHLANSAPQSISDDPPGYDIPLTRRGNHYLVSAAINGIDQLALIIDTGASITTLSKEGFSRIEGTGVRYLGTQLFNTPNGITQGELYHAASIQLGDTEVRELEIAVLDFESSGGFDGLLGMNVLRNYRFEINQDREVLHLSPRF